MRLIEVLDAHHRHGRKSELPGSGQPPMAGDDLASLVHEKRADKVERPDGLSDLRDLPLGMAPGIPVIAGKAGRRDVLDGERDLAGVLGRVASSLIERLTTGVVLCRREGGVLVNGFFAYGRHGGSPRLCRAR